MLLLKTILLLFFILKINGENIKTKFFNGLKPFLKLAVKPKLITFILCNVSITVFSS